MVRMEFTGRVKFEVTWLDSESVTVTENVTGPADGGVPDSTPAAEIVNQAGSPVAE